MSYIDLWMDNSYKITKEEYEKHFGKALKKYAEKDNMCPSTGCINSGNKQNQIMKDALACKPRVRAFGL